MSIKFMTPGKNVIIKRTKDYHISIKGLPGSKFEKWTRITLKNLKEYLNNPNFIFPSKNTEIFPSTTFVYDNETDAELYRLRF